jgi:hypothetical protein
MPVMSFKVDSQSAGRIRAKARANKSSLSAYLRKAALGDDRRHPVKIVRGKHPISGLPYNAATGARVVTNDEIRDALADFP